MIEIAIRIADENQTLKVKHVLYDTIVTVSQEDPTLKTLVQEAIKDFKGDVQDVNLTIKMQW